MNKVNLNGPNHLNTDGFLSILLTMVLLDEVRPQFDSALRAMKELSQAESIEDIDVHALPYGKEILCKACKTAFNFLVTSHNSYLPDQVTRTALVSLCSFIKTYEVCQGLIDINMPIFIEIIQRKPEIQGEQACGTVFEDLCATSPVVEWSMDIPDLVQTSEGKERSIARRDTEVVEIAHVSDTHVDLQYAAGSAVGECKEPLCCREYQQPTDPAEVAGVWGDYRECDVPSSTVENMWLNLNQHKNIEYVYMTGDLIAHNIWETSKEANIKQIQDQAASFYKVLGDRVNIFPVLGNHEPHPANVLAPPGIEGYSGEWLYEVFYESWCQHLPAEAKTTFMKGGYYTVTPTAGFRIIGLNSLFGYVYNWWMILDPVDPGGQLQWLLETLLQAERNRESVHILMHGPSSETDTLQVWRREFLRIINRFQSTVSGQFVGHTHRDQFYVMYGPHSTEPVSVVWNGGSVTPYKYVNPNYRIYTVNKHTWEVEDFDTYIYNLTEANDSPMKSPNWFKLYSFKDAYNVPTLRPPDVDALAKKMASDDKLHDQYFMYYMKNSDFAVKKGCDAACREKQLCKIVSAPNNSTQCQKILHPNGKILYND